MEAIFFFFTFLQLSRHKALHYFHENTMNTHESSGLNFAGNYFKVALGAFDVKNDRNKY